MSSTDSVVRIAVEYCGAWGYASRFEQLKEGLEAHFKTRVAVKGTVGRRSCFEITGSKSDSTDGATVTFYSKLKQGGFPDPDQLIKSIENYLEKGEILPVAESSSCVIA